KRRSPNGPGYRVSDQERAAGGLDNQPRTARACRGSSNRESRARDQRAVNQRKSMELVVLIPRGLERNCYGAAVDEQPVENRGGLISAGNLNSARWGQYRPAAVGCPKLYGLTRRYRDCRRLYKGFITVYFYDAAR